MAELENKGTVEKKSKSRGNSMDQGEEDTIQRTNPPKNYTEVDLSESIEILLSLVCVPMMSGLKWTNHHKTLARQFLTDPKENFLCCFVLGGPDSSAVQPARLTVSLTLPTTSSGLIWYFFKCNSNTPAINCLNGVSLSFGSVDTNDPRGLEVFFETVLQPYFLDYSMNSVPNNDEPGFKLLDKVDLELMEATNFHSKLVDVPMLFYQLGAEIVQRTSLSLDNPRLFLPTEVRHLKLNEDFTLCNDQKDRMEVLFLHWVEQLHFFVFKFGRSPSPTEMGLLYEIRHIAIKSESLEKLRSFCSLNNIKALSNFFRNLGSPFVILLDEVLEKLEEVQDEINKQKVHLLKLEGPLERFYVDPLGDLIKNLCEVMALLRILWENSPRHEDMLAIEDICLRISWEVVRACQLHIPLEIILSTEGVWPASESSPKQEDAQPQIESTDSPEKSLETSKSESLDGDKSETIKPKDYIQKVISCCEQWRTFYQELYEHFQDPDSYESWLPESSLTFLPINLFLARCEDLRYIFLSRYQLSRYDRDGKCILTLRAASGLGISSQTQMDLLDEELSQVDSVLHSTLKSIENKSRTAFNLTSKDWLKHFDKFRERIEEIEQRYQCVMISAVQSVENTAQGLEVLNAFKPLASRKSLFPVFYTMLDCILNLIEFKIDDTEEQYAFKSLLIGRPDFSYSEMASWAQQSRKKLEQEIMLIKNHRWLPYYNRLDILYRKWSKTSELLKLTVQSMNQQWLASLNQGMEGRLRIPIFRWKQRERQSIEVNFDMTLLKDLNEAHAWNELGISIPERLKTSLTDYKKLITTKEKVFEATKLFNSLVWRISEDELQLFKGHLESVVQMFHHGLTTITWNDYAKIPVYLKSCHVITKEVEVEIDKYLEINNDLSSEIETIETWVMYKKPSLEVYTQDQFTEDITNQRAQVIEKIKEVHKKIEMKLNEVRFLLKCDASKQSEQTFQRYIMKVDQIFFNALIEICRRSFYEMEGILIGCRDCPPIRLPPAFEISIDIKNFAIVCEPPMDMLLKVIDNLNELFILALKQIPMFLNLIYPEIEIVDRDFKDEVCYKMQKKLTDQFKQHVDNFQNYLRHWENYDQLWKVSQSEFFRLYKSNEPSVNDYEKDLESVNSKRENIQEFAQYTLLGVFYVNNIDIKTKLIQLCNEWSYQYLEKAYQEGQERILKAKTIKQNVESSLSKSIDGLGELEQIKKECNVCKETVVEYLPILETTTEYFDLLEKYNFQYDKELKKDLSVLVTNWPDLSASIVNRIIEISDIWCDYRKRFILKREEIVCEINRFGLKFLKELPTNFETDRSSAIMKQESLFSEIQELKKHEETNKELQILDLPLIDYSLLSVHENDIDSLNKIWSITDNWQSCWNVWVQMSIWNCSVLSIQESVTDIQLRYNHICSSNLNIEKWGISKELRDQMNSCKKLIPLIVNIQNSKLRPHHWNKIKDVLKRDFDENSNQFNIEVLKSLNMIYFEDEINNIFSQSLEEYKVVKFLEGIEQNCNNFTLELTHAPHLNVYIVETNINNITEINDIIMSLHLNSVRETFVHYQDNAHSLRIEVEQMVDLIELLQSFQVEWLRWESFFRTTDVRHFLVNLSTIFMAIDQSWRSYTTELNSEPNLKKIVQNPEKIQCIKKMMEDFNNFDQLVKSFLYEKCYHCPRLYFLSMNDILDAISCTFEGEKAKKFLPKIFSNISTLKQQLTVNSTYQIIGVYSQEGEFLELNNYVATNDDFSRWLNSLEMAVRSTLIEDTKQCKSSMRTIGVRFEELLKVWPLQACVIAYLNQWSTDVARLGQKNKIKEESIAKLRKKLQDLSSHLSNYSQEPMPAILRTKLIAFHLTVLDSHMHLDNLTTSSIVDHVPNFSYSIDKNNDELTVQIGLHNYSYSWEYAGIWTPTVLSSVAYKAMNYITSILSNNLSVGLISSGGNGKSETIRSLSRLLGRHLFTIPYSDSLSLDDISRVMLGVSQTTTWLLVEKSQNLTNQNIFQFSDWISCLSKNNTMFSYQEHIEKILPLPQGLSIKPSLQSAVIFEFNESNTALRILNSMHSILRPVHLRTTPLTSVVESILTTMGITNAQKLSRILNTFLSHLSHAIPDNNYDKCMITLSRQITNLVMIKKQSASDLEELEILGEAIKDIFLPRIQTQYQVIFDNLFETLFPDLEYTHPDNQKLKTTMKIYIDSEKLWCSEKQLELAVIINEFISTNDILVLHGMCNTGKVLTLKMLANSLCSLSNAGNKEFKPTSISLLNPQNIDPTQLYGERSRLCRTRELGYLYHQFAKFHELSAPNYHWIVLYGIGNADWVKYFFQRYSMQKNCLYLNNNQQINKPKKLKFIIVLSGNSDNYLSNIPASVPIVYFPNEVLPWKSVLEQSISILEPKDVRPHLLKFVNNNLQDFLDAMSIDLTNNAYLILKGKVFLALLCFMFVDYISTSWQMNDEANQIINISCILAVVWSYCSEYQITHLSNINEVASRISNSLAPDDDILDYFIDKNGKLLPWKKILKTNKEDKFETNRYSVLSFITNIIQEKRIPIAFSGSSGSGKTFMLSLLGRNSTENTVTLSAHTQFSSEGLQKFLISNQTLVRDNPANLQAINIQVDDIHNIESSEDFSSMIAVCRSSTKCCPMYTEKSADLEDTRPLHWVYAYDNEKISFQMESQLRDSCHIFQLFSFETHLEDFVQVLFTSIYDYIDLSVKEMKDIICDALIYVFKKANEKSSIPPKYFDVFYHPKLLNHFFIGLKLCQLAWIDDRSIGTLFIHVAYQLFKVSGIMSRQVFEEICEEISTEYFCLSPHTIPIPYESIIFTNAETKFELYTEKNIEHLRPTVKQCGNTLNQFSKENIFIEHTYVSQKIFSIMRSLNVSSLQKINTLPSQLKASGNCLLFGASGSGKTTSARIAVKMIGADMIDFHSLPKNEEALLSMLRSITQKTIILVKCYMLEFWTDIVILDKVFLSIPNYTEGTNVSVICSTQTYQQTEQLKRYFPFFFRDCTTIMFEEFSFDDLKEISEVALKETLFNSRNLTNFTGYSKALEYLFTSVKGSDSDNYTFSCHYYKLVNNFLQRCELEFRKMEKEQLRLQGNIKEFKQTTKKVNELTEQLKAQQNQVGSIQQTCGNTVLKMRNIKSEQNRLQEELNKKSSLLSRQREESIRIKELIDQDLEGPRLQLQKVHKELIRVTKEDLEYIRKALRPTSIAETVFGTVLLMLGYDTTWSEVKKQISDSLHFITDIRDVKVENMSEQVLDQVRNILSKEEINSEAVAQESPVILTFLHWIHAFENNARVYKDYHPLKLQADAIDKDIEETQNTVKSYQHDLANFSVQHKVLLKQLGEREKMLEETEEKMKALELKIQTAHSVVEKLELDHKSWFQSLEDIKLNEQFVLSQSLITDGYITLLGHLPQEKRKEYIDLWKSFMIKKDLPVKDFDISSVISLHDQVQWQSCSLDASEFCFENVFLLMTAGHKIVLDPLMIILPFCRNFPNFTYVDSLREDVTEQILRNISSNQANYVYIESDCFSYVVKVLLTQNCLQWEEDNELTVSLYGKSYKLHTTFKLIIIVRNIDFVVPDSIKAKSSCVNMTNTYPTLVKLIRFYQQNVQLEDIETLYQLKQDLLERQKRKLSQEKDVHNLMSRFDEGLVDGSPLLEQLQAVCDKLAESRKVITSLIQQMTDCQSSIDKFQSTAVHLANLYNHLHVLMRNEKKIHLTFQQFVKLTVNQLTQREGQITWNYLLDGNMLLVSAQNLYRHFQQHCPESTLTAIGVILASWYGKSLNLLRSELIPLLTMDFSHEIGCNRAENTVSSWLPEDRWQYIQTISQHQIFKDLPSNLGMNSSLWNEWCCSEQPENVALPMNMERSIKGFARLILIRCLRPDRFQPAANKYINRTLRLTSQASNIGSTLTTFCGMSYGSNPLIIQSEDHMAVEHMIRKIQMICHPVLTNNNGALVIISVSMSHIELIKQQLDFCLEKGYWILLKIFQEDNKAICSIASHYLNQTRDLSNKRFKLWIYNECNVRFPVVFYQKAQVVYLANTGYLKEKIEHYYELLGENRIEFYVTEQSKWLLLSITLFHIACVARQSLIGDTASITQLLSSSTYEWLEEQLNLSISNRLSDYHLLQQLYPFYAAGNLNEENHADISQLIQYYLHPDPISQLTSFIPAFTHYSVPSTCCITDHFSALEFVYKESPLKLSNALPSIQYFNCSFISKKIIQMIKEPNQIETKIKVYQLQETLRKKLQNFLLSSVELSLSEELKVLIKYEKKILQSLTRKFLDRNDSLNSLNLDNYFSNSILCIDENRQEYLTKYYEQITSKIEFIESFNWVNSGKYKLWLGGFVDPMSFWTWVCRNQWQDPHYQEMVEVTVMKGNEAQDDLPPVLELIDILLVGASWDKHQQQLIPTLFPQLESIFSVVSLNVVPATENLKKICLKNSKMSCRIPVYFNIFKHCPLLWITVCHNSEMTEKDIQGVRFLIQ